MAGFTLGRQGFSTDRPNGTRSIGDQFYAVDAQVLYEWNGASWIEVGSDAGRMESIGAQIDQTLARTERDRWLALARDGGSAAPSAPSIHYIGGDISDGIRLVDGSVLWVGPDSLQNPGSTQVVDANDRYTINILAGLVRNAGVLEANPGGTFTQQLHRTGDTGTWLDPVIQAGYPAGRLWWPMTVVQIGTTVHVGCIHVDTATPAPFGTYIDSHLVTLNAFLGYDSTTELGLDTRLFTIEAIRKDAIYAYILGSQTIPPADAGPVEPNYGFGTLAELRTQRVATRIARVPLAQLTTVAAWKFWCADGWIDDLVDADPMVDVDGIPVVGPACIHLTDDGHWILVTMALADTHLNVYSSPEPQGPWRLISRVPVPVAGKLAEGGISVAWHNKVIDHLAAPPEHSVVSATMAVIGLVGTGQGMNIRRTVNQFVVVPWY